MLLEQASGADGGQGTARHSRAQLISDGLLGTFGKEAFVGWAQWALCLLALQQTVPVNVCAIELKPCHLLGLGSSMFKRKSQGVFRCALRKGTAAALKSKQASGA